MPKELVGKMPVTDSGTRNIIAHHMKRAADGDEFRGEGAVNRPRCSHVPVRLRSVRVVLPSVCDHVMVTFVISNTRASSCLRVDRRCSCQRLTDEVVVVEVDSD